VLVALALALIASACGGGEDDAESATTTTTAAPAGGSDGGAADATTTTTEPVSGDSGSTYCERVRQAEASNETPLDFSFFGKTAAELEAQFARNLAVFEEWRDLAPREIEADAEVVLNFYRTFVERGNELGWDLEAMADDEAFTAGFDDPVLDTATTNLDNHSREVCGVDIADSVADPGPTPGLPTDGDDPVTILLSTFGIPAGLIAEEAIECLREELGPEFEAKITPDYELTTDDTLLLVAAVDACEIGLG
jgi:hypothetical protein